MSLSITELIAYRIVEHVIIGLFYSAPILWSRLFDLGFIPPPPGWLDSLVSILSIGLVAHLCYVTLRGRTDDLLDKRRASRIYFVIILFCVTVVAAVSEPFLPADVIPTETFKVMSIWPAILWGVYWMTSFDQKAVTFSEDAPPQTELSERDKALHEKLESYMVSEEAYTDPALTIISLATQLGVSQHRLRALINQSLGYPNFSAYLNGYRIEAVKSAFADSKFAHIPILTIAMDSGFKSLSPFNRAFKNSEHMTPTQYRKTLKS
ncbi:MAG: AraC family transcriptional regulator [Hellea sp.]